MKLNKKKIFSCLSINLPVCLLIATNLTSCANGLIEKNDKLECTLNDSEKVKEISITNTPIENRICNFNIPFSKKDTSIKNDDLKKIIFNVDLITVNKYIDIAQCYSFCNDESLTVEIDFWIRLSILGQENNQETLFNIVAIDNNNNWKQIFEGFKISVQIDK